MARIFWLVVGTLAALFVLRGWGAFGTGYLAYVVDYILGLACTFACPLFFLSLVYAPGLFRELTGSWERFWHSVLTRRRTIEQLKHKVARLDKAHHMTLLGTEYLRQEKYGKALPWFERALEKDPELLDARYKLGVCHFHRQEYEEALQPLEHVHAEKPDLDYGMAYLRLAQTHQKLGNAERAEQAYQTLLKYYPGQPEGSYWYAMLKAEQGDKEGARELLRDLTFSLKHSPAFQRRRNRHWALKAHWWLWRHRGE